MVTIRPAEPFDRDAIWSLLRHAPLPDGTVPTKDDWPAELDDIPSNFSAFWVAVDTNSTVIGTVGLQDSSIHPATVAVPDFMARSKRTARLRRLDVDPRYQRKGVGRRLSQEAVDWARDQGFDRVILDTTTLQLSAIALYESMGFIRVGNTRFRRWNIVWFELAL